MAGLAAVVVVALALAIICLVYEEGVEDNRDWDERRKDFGAGSGGCS